MRTDEGMRTAVPMTAPGRATRGRWSTGILVLALVVGVAVGALGGGLMARGELDDRETALVAARADVGRLQERVDAVTAQLADADAGIARIERRLARAAARLDTFVGPALPDGRHFGSIDALGANQYPPRVVFDLARWFFGDEADAAAIADGAMPPGQIHIENGFYIRNESPRWRIVEVDPAATVALVTYPYGDIDHPRVVSLDRFAEITAEDPTLLRWSPFWLVVRDGVVVALEQQYIP